MINIFRNTNALNKKLANLFVEKSKEAITKYGKFTVALTGGSSPEGLYKLLGTDYKDKIEWDKVFLFWGDERWVPLDDEKSNAGAAFKAFLNEVPIPKSQIFPMWKEGFKPEEYEKEYEKILEEHLQKSSVFDLILLGMGEDGHTASLFPGEEVLHEKRKNVAAYYLEAQDMYRITLTAPLINKAKNIVFIVFGGKKTDALYEVLQGERNPNLYPAQLIKPRSGKLYWMLGKVAAKKLDI